MLKTLLLAAFALATGCVTFASGPVHVDERVATAYGCDAELVRLRAVEVSKDLGAGRVWVPQVGWNACNLLAHNGTPNDIDTQTSEYGRSATWWYRGYRESRMVRLEWRAPDWRVIYVGW